MIFADTKAVQQKNDQMLEKIREILMPLGVPDEQELSDFHILHFVLNKWPISDTEEDADRVDARLETVIEEDKEALAVKCEMEVLIIESLWKRRFLC